MTPQASSGSTISDGHPTVRSDVQPSLSLKEGLGPLSAELLVVCLDPEKATKTLVPFLEAQGICFAGDRRDPLLIQARITSVTRHLPREQVSLPTDMESCSAALCDELRDMGGLRLVLVLGISAHIAVLGACGIPLTRLDFRPGEITCLPDGLLLADACHPLSEEADPDLLTQRKNALIKLIPQIRSALRPSA
ncbi:hypothetical protein WH158_01945 [Gluconobacter cerinus]|uniref:hypothetical protein n=1 Tax=Gluconobacter cerinus TaxID=38307 RepID=UPI0030A8D47F